MIKKINFEELDLKGAFKIQPFYATDERGGFVKDYNIDVFKSNGIEQEAGKGTGADRPLPEHPACNRHPACQRTEAG